MTREQLPPGLTYTGIVLPVEVKQAYQHLAIEAGTTDRIEVIAALTAWTRNPDPDIRAEVQAAYHRKRNNT